jgi:hypothetical protein
MKCDMPEGFGDLGETSLNSLGSKEYARPGEDGVG